MAKRLIDWNLNGSVLVMGRYVDAESPAEELVKFELDKLFPKEDHQVFDEDGDIISWEGFKGLTEIQQFIFVYGLKQKLADAGSQEKDPEEKARIAKEKFQDFVKGELSGARANGTGAKENKRIADIMREKVKVVSMEGLFLKKMNFPDTFTEEDQVKLDEFMAVSIAHREKEEKRIAWEKGDGDE